MYSNNIQNYQKSTTILNARIKKSGNLLNTPRICTTVNLSWRMIRTNSSGVLGYRWAPTLGQMTRPNNSQQNVRTCKIVDFAVSADHGVKLKETEQKDKGNEILWIIKVTVISFVIVALYIVTKGLVQGLEELEIRTTSVDGPIKFFFRSASLLRVPETWGDLLPLKILGGIIGYRRCEKLSNDNNNNTGGLYRHRNTLIFSDPLLSLLV